MPTAVIFNESFFTFDFICVNSSLKDKAGAIPYFLLLSTKSYAKTKTNDELIRLTNMSHAVALGVMLLHHDDEAYLEMHHPPNVKTANCTTCVLILG